MTKSKTEKKYYQGVGRRKTAIARVRIIQQKGEEVFDVEGVKVGDYFSTEKMVQTVKCPLESAGIKKDYIITVHLSGGGLSSQADAVKLGLARALVKLNDELQKTFRSLGYLKRDSRQKERKKPGLKKARRAPQWNKR